MNASGRVRPHAELRLLLDTNVFISAEPYGQLPADIERATELIRLAQEQRHRIYIHPATVDDIHENTDDERRSHREAQLGRYMTVEESPISSELIALAGDSPAGSNDHRDLRILASLRSRAVTHLVTNDKRLRNRARRAGLGDSTYSVDETIEQLRQLLPQESNPPPLVRRIQAYTLDTDQVIFESLRTEYYPDFDKWMDKVRSQSEHRPCFIVETDVGNYAGLTLLKLEDPSECEFLLEQPVIKVSTFKVDPNRPGMKYGELLLKGIFRYAYEQRIASLYVTAFDHHESLIYLLKQFGFRELPSTTTSLGEIVLAKTLRGTRDQTLDPLEFHRLYGPPAIHLRPPAWVIPIYPKWHAQLFPDSPINESQPTLPGLAATPYPWGNALRKAYLCNSRATSMRPGDTILFYRSQDASAISEIGVIEDTLRSSDPSAILNFVGNRTVYTPDDIARMCAKSGVLAILFRHDRTIEPAWRLGEVIENGLLSSHPQSVTRTKEEGITWLGQRLAEWP